MTGSPPQVRGKLLFGGACGIRYGITPAGAGKTQTTLSTLLSKQDHPRRCGENCVDSLLSRGEKGSPPQVRGKLISTVLQGITQRITPAGAGKTIHHSYNVRRSRDHPRRCGENHALYESRLPYPGSPPQVRGKPSPLKPRSGLSRITPAGAGKTV